MYKPGEINSFWIRDNEWLGQNCNNDNDFECPTCLCSFKSYQGLFCSEGHFLCKTDLNKYVKMCTDDKIDINIIVKTEGHLKCYQKNCNAIYENSTLSFLLSVEERTKYMKSFHRTRTYMQSQVLSQKLSESRDFISIVNQETIRRQFRIISDNGDISYSAYMCPNCNFGPVDHKNCHNLQTHQGEISGKGKINNACPKCKYFTSKLSDWLKWDGKFLE